MNMRTKLPIALLGLLLLAPSVQAARLTVGTATGAAGGSATLTLTYAAEGASASILQVELTASAPLSFSSVSAGAAATAAGKQVSTSPISGGVRLLVFGLNQTAMGDGVLATVTYAIAAGAAAGSYGVTAAQGSAADGNGVAIALTTSSGTVTVGGGGGGTTDPGVWVLPSSARAAGLGGTFFSTDLTVSNSGTTDTTFTLKFLGNNQDGSNGPESSFSLAAGRSITLSDVLSSVFGLSSGFGAIQIRSASTSLGVVSQTSTPGTGGGSYGQSVPATRSASFISFGAPRSISAVREDASFRTNLILANAGPSSVDVQVSLISGAAANLGTKTYTLPPLGMTQVTRVVRDLGAQGDVVGARLVIVPVTSGGKIATYASAIDNVTGDPRTLLPQ